MAFDLAVQEKDKEKSHYLLCQKWYFDSVGNDEVKGERVFFYGPTEHCSCFNNSQNHWLL